MRGSRLKGLLSNSQLVKVLVNSEASWLSPWPLAAPLQEAVESAANRPVGLWEGDSGISEPIVVVLPSGQLTCPYLTAPVADETKGGMGRSLLCVSFSFFGCGSAALFPSIKTLS
jgi:hypothetical protein